MAAAVVLMMGRSFSGKSTVAAALARSLPARTLSYDAINAERGLHGGQGVPVEEWARTDETARIHAAELLAKDAIVVVDDTSSRRFLRDRWRALAADAAVPFLLVFLDVDPAVVWTRLLADRANAVRADVVDSVMADHLAAFEPPAADEPHLRFDDSATSAAVSDAVRAALDC